MATGETTATVGGMFGAGFGILERQLPLIGVIVLLTLGQQAVKLVALPLLGPVGSPLVQFIVGVAVYIINVMLVREVMVREGLADAAIPLRFGTYLGVTIVVSFATGAAAILLVVPGIMLLLRWYLAPYFVLSRGAGFDEALSASRDATEGHRWAILGVFLLVGLVYAVFIGALMGAGGGIAAFAQATYWGPLTIVIMLVQAVLGGVSVAVLLGTFAALVDQSNQFEDVFG
jgi:hypothetical protein